MKRIFKTAEEKFSEYRETHEFYEDENGVLYRGFDNNKDEDVIVVDETEDEYGQTMYVIEEYCSLNDIRDCNTYVSDVYDACVDSDEFFNWLRDNEQFPLSLEEFRDTFDWDCNKDVCFENDYEDCSDYANSVWSSIFARYKGKSFDEILAEGEFEKLNDTDLVYHKCGLDFYIHKAEDGVVYLLPNVDIVDDKTFVDAEDGFEANEGNEGILYGTDDYAEKCGMDMFQANVVDLFDANIMNMMKTANLGIIRKGDTLYFYNAEKCVPTSGKTPVPVEDLFGVSLKKIPYTDDESVIGVALK